MTTALDPQSLPIIQSMAYGLSFPSIALRLHGLTPLLMSNPVGLFEKAESAGASRGKAVSAVRGAEEEAERSAYRSPDGTLRFPAPGVRRSFFLAASGFTWPVPGKKRQEPLNRLFGLVTLMPEEWIAVRRDDAPVDTFVIDSRRAVNRTTKGAVVTHRACVQLPWSLDIVLLWDRGESLNTPRENQIFGTMLVDNAIRAGRMVGIGAFRPEKTGWFGRYTVEVR